MNSDVNPKIVGATVIGFALIFGAYIIQNLKQDTLVVQPAMVIEAPDAPPRVSIAVSDNNNNGIEDWRDEFITTPPIYLSSTSGVPYTPPTTLTGRAALDLVEGYIGARSAGPFGDSREVVAQRTVDLLASATEQKIHQLHELSIMEDWEEKDVLNYANTLAATIERYDIKDANQELLLLHSYMNKLKDGDNSEDMEELRQIANTYKSYRDDALLIPVPDFLAKPHLDLINTFEAIYTDIEAMTVAEADPARTLLRLKRYEEDAEGLQIALRNLFDTLVPYAHLVDVDDPAIMFVIFSENYETSI
jgi:hypothetical protein